MIRCIRVEFGGIFLAVRGISFISGVRKHPMLAMRLVRLIEAHSEALSRGLAEQIRKSDRTTDFRKIPADELRLAAIEVYRNLGEWLLQKTDADIAERFRAVAARRAAEGIPVHQFAWAIMLSRDHVLQFLRKEGFADNIIALDGEMGLQRMLNQFFDRALYYALQGYEEAEPCGPKGDLARARDLAISIGLLAEKTGPPEIFED